MKADLTGLTFHGLRHSAAGLLIALGAPDPVLRERMGHSSNRVTRDVYRHVLPIVDDAVTTEIDRLFSDPSRTIAHETETAKLSQPRSSKLTRGNCSGGAASGYEPRPHLSRPPIPPWFPQASALDLP